MLKLAHYRQIGDDPADQMVAALVSDQGLGVLRQLMPELSDFHQATDKVPDIVKDLREKLSFDLDLNTKKKIIRATRFYTNQEENIGLVLGLYALPYCYLGADGAKVLYLSARIKNDTYQRLKETGAFLNAVLNLDNWENGQVFTIIAKVRLLHAFIRYFTNQSGKWDLSWGYPINQEDMLGTNLAFSYIVLKGLEKMGIAVDEQSQKSYYFIWQKIGVLLGILPELIPLNRADSFRLDAQISKRQFRSSKEGIALTASLTEMYGQWAPNEWTKELFMSQTRYLLGQKYADMLEIPETKVPIELLNTYHQTKAFFSKILN